MKKTTSKIKKMIDNEGPIKALFAPLIHFSPEPIKSILIVTREEIEEGFKVDLPLKHRLRAYKHGFTSKFYSEYDLQNSSNLNKYLSRFSEVNSYSKIHKNKELLTNKIKFYSYMKQKGLDEYLPKLYGIIKDGEVKGNIDFYDILQKNKKVVVKPYRGGRGRSIYFFEMRNGNIKVNGEEIDEKELRDIIENIKCSIVTEYCDQADFLDEINPISTNTIRILTINYKKEWILVFAFLRIGTQKSGFVDNTSQGGLAAGIDLNNGELNCAAEKISPGKVKWHQTHPDTKSKIRGVKITEWKKFISEFKSVIGNMDEFNCVGWDILLTSDEKFVIIEGNNKGPGLRSGQRFCPILKDSRVKEFYKKHGVPL